MIDPEIKQALDEMSAKTDATYKAVEKIRKYLFWTMIITVAVIVIPLMFLPSALSSLMSSYSSVGSL